MAGTRAVLANELLRDLPDTADVLSDATSISRGEVMLLRPQDDVAEAVRRLLR